MLLRRNLLLAAISTLGLAWAWPLLGQASPPPSGWFGNVYLGGGRTPFRADKVYAVTYRVSDKSVALADIVLAYGTARTLPPARSDFVVELLTSDGRPLSSRTATDPRAVIVEHQGNVMLPSGVLTVRVPFSPSGSRIRLHSASTGATVETDVRAAEAAFCYRNGNDPDCRAIRPR